VRDVMAADQDRRRAGVLVLKNGRVLEGRVSVVKTGFQLNTDRGRVVVPRDLVEVEGRDLEDAYAKLRARMPQRSASRHIVLGKWCLSHGLAQQALTEFQAAEKLAPRNPTARGMIARLDPTLRPRGHVPTVSAATALMSRDAEPVAPLGGLRRDLARSFVQRIQPLLSHRCGNGSCHGPSAMRSFRLQPIGRDRSGFAVRTRKNLAAVLQSARHSMTGEPGFLDRVQQPHGLPGRRLPMSLNTGQKELIARWVRDVLATPPGSKSVRREATPQGQSTVPPARVQNPAGSLLQGASVNSGATPSTPRDVFDPGPFNRETRRREAMRLKRAASSRPAGTTKPMDALRSPRGR